MKWTGPLFALAVVLIGDVARALPSVEAHADLTLDARYSRFSPDIMGLRHLATVGVSARGDAGWSAFGYRAGLDMRIGAASAAGFAYDVALYPLGLAMPVAGPVSFGVLAGVGSDAVTSAVVPSLAFPVEFSARVRIGFGAYLDGWATPRWLATPSRRGGTTRVRVGDDMSAGLRLRIGKGGERYGARWGNGYYVGGTYAEMLGATAWGVVVGYGLDMSGGDF